MEAMTALQATRTLLDNLRFNLNLRLALDQALNAGEYRAHPFLGVDNAGVVDAVTFVATLILRSGDVSVRNEHGAELLMCIHLAKQLPHRRSDLQKLLH